MTTSNRYIPYELRWKTEPAILSLTAGFIDTVGFIGLFGLFTNHITGNLIIAGAAIAGGSSAILAKLLTIPVFMISIALASTYIYKNAALQERILSRLFFFESFLLALFMLVAVTYSPLKGPDSWDTILAGMLGVSAMGLRITMARLLLDKLPHSTVMTGNIAQITFDLMTMLFGRQRTSSDAVSIARKRFLVLLPICLAFIFGAALGAGGYIYFKFYCLLLPIILIFILGLKEYYYFRNLKIYND